MKRFYIIISLLFIATYMYAQQVNHVDFKTIKANIGFEVSQKRVKGDVRYQFKVLKQTDSIYLDAGSGIESFEIESNDFYPNLIYRDNRLVLTNTEELLEGAIYNFRLIYTAKPKKAMYFIGDQIWTQGQGKYTSNWLPSVDDVNDKIEFDLSITAESSQQVLANGKLIGKTVNGDMTTWEYDMERPMSSYLVALAVGEYDMKAEVSESGIPLELFYYPEDSLKAEPTYRYTKQMFDFLESEIGVPYPWQNYKQVPVKDFLYSGMENTGLTIFSDSFVVDSIAYNDKNYITVNAHEMAHQWFGDLVTATTGEHHWLQEGFATYYALLAEKDIFGEDHYYWQLYENAQELIAQESAGQSTSLLDPKSSSTTFYKKGAWALHILRELVGDEAFRTAVQAYLEKYQFDNVTTEDFLTEVRQASGQDLTAFENDWLLEVTLPEEAILESLNRSEFMQEYFLVNCEVYSSKCPDYLVTEVSDKAKVKVVSQLGERVDKRAFANGLEVRQALANYISEIPRGFKYEYESLLNDESYATVEAALYNLWVNFPQDRGKYLQQTKDIYGFNTNNVRLLWLALHLNTPEYQPKEKIAVLEEMVSYSLPDQHFELRMNAFKYLQLIGGFEIKSMRSLIAATKHHNWRFAKFSKELLSSLEEDLNYKILIGQLKQE